ncbi:MAG: hypothetical protein ACKN9I_01475, partial [Alphaproteobacteria bacterium]
RKKKGGKGKKRERKGGRKGEGRRRKRGEWRRFNNNSISLKKIITKFFGKKVFFNFSSNYV